MTLSNSGSGPGQVLPCEALVCGFANAPKVLLTRPLSFWGGYDSVRGVIIDEAHPEFGQSLAGTIIVMTHAKGSSSSSSVLAEAIRNGTGPRGIVLLERDLIICIGAIVAKELYGLAVPVVVLDKAAFQNAGRGRGNIEIHAEDGTRDVHLRLLDEAYAVRQPTSSEAARRP